MLNTADLQDIIYTSMTDDINVTINNLYLFIPNLIPSVETQLLFNDATENNYKISYGEYYTKKRVILDLLGQHDIGSAQQVNSPKCLIRAHQTKNRIDTPKKNNNIAILDNLEYIGEPILNPFISYPDMETKYSIGKIDLRHQPDHIKPIRIQFFQEYVTDLDIVILFLILIRRREIELINDGNKSIEAKVIKIGKFQILKIL